jgi:uncharacterized LabA/DUF88 family protein
MVFIDEQNFQIALQSYYRAQNLPAPRLDYNKLPLMVNACVPNAVLVKTLLCAPRPDEFLQQDDAAMRHYRWIEGLRNQSFFDVIEGAFIARPTTYGVEMNINDRSSYYREEKGTDINIAVESITKAFNNAYDVAIFMSGDSDYLPIYKTLRTIGKLVVVAVVEGQSVMRLRPFIDHYIVLDKCKFDGILRPPAPNYAAE